MVKELTPSEYEQLVATTSTVHNNKPLYIKYAAAAVVVVLLLCIGSFMAGEHYGKTHALSTTATGTGQNAFNGGRFGNRRPRIGQVTAISSDSVTITNQRTGNSETFKITSSTTVTNNGVTAAVSDIKTGDTIFVQTASGDTTTATQIILNPSFGPQGGSMQSAPDSTTTPSTTQST